jgi:hypothetical protein
MSPLAFCERVQATWSSTWLRESTWGFPIIGAIHVLGIAWFGGSVLIPELGRQLRSFQRMGLAALLGSGALLFWLEPVKCYKSEAFRVKIGLLALAALLPLWRGRLGFIFSLAIWLAMIFVSVCIAYY